MKCKKISINYKKICILIISIIIVMIILPPKRHYKVNEKFYQEHGIEYHIVQCPECGRDVADVQQFCYNCGAVLFDADERMLEFLDKVHENLKPTRTELILGYTKKVIIYTVLILFVNFLISKMLALFYKIALKLKKNKG